MTFFGPDLRNGLPIGLGSVAGFGIAPRFSPASLFTGGVNGVWYDPSDATTLFSDRAGTTPCGTPGGGSVVPVGAMLDKRAAGYSVFFDGNGDEISAGSSAAFAFGTGAYTVEFWVYLTAAVGAGHQPCFVFIPPTNGWGIWNENGGGQLSIRSSGVANVVTSTTTLAASQWNHVVAVRSGTGAGQTSIFVNGTRVANGTDATNWTVQGPLQVGGITTANYYVTGYMSNVRVVKGVAVYDPTQSTLTVPTSPLSPISGTSLLTCGTSWTGNPAITKNGDARVDGLNPFQASPVGNHAIAANDTTARPELRARVNLLTYSEDFGNAAWAASAATVATNTVAAPNGTLTADTLSWTTSGSTLIQSVAVTSGASYTFSVYLRVASGSRTVNIGNIDSGVWSTVTVTTDWQRFTVTQTASAATRFPGLQSGVGGGGSDVYIWGAQLTATNEFPANTYQRIVDANTYDAVGFPRYFVANGTSSAMSTPGNVNLSGTDKVTVFAGVRKLSDAPVYPTIVEFSVNSSTNTGSFSVYASGSSTSRYPVYLFGTASTGYEPQTYAAPISNVLAVGYDIGAADRSTEVIPRINGVVNQTNPVATAAAGTGNFGSYPLFIGSRNNSSLFLTGNIYSLIVVGSAVSAGQISATEQWVAGKVGITI